MATEQLESYHLSENAWKLAIYAIMVISPVSCYPNFVGTSDCCFGKFPPPFSLSHSPTVTHSLTPQLSLPTLTPQLSLPHSPTLTPSLPHSLTPSLPHSLTPSLPHSLTPSLSLTPYSVLDCKSVVAMAIQSTVCYLKFKCSFKLC